MSSETGRDEGKLYREIALPKCQVNKLLLVLLKNINKNKSQDQGTTRCGHVFLPSKVVHQKRVRWKAEVYLVKVGCSWWWRLWLWQTGGFPPDLGNTEN